MNQPPTERNRRILVIDDNASIHADFRKILVERDSDQSALAQAEAELFGVPAAARPERPVFELTSAFQGQEGLEQVRNAVAKKQPFAMAFVDVRMPPGWDGIETTARLWEVDPELLIVICTAYSDYSWDEMMARLGVSDRMVILKKPFDTVEVLQLANALTEKWALSQQVKMKFQDLEQIVANRTKELQDSNDRFRKEVRERLRAEQVLRGTQEKLNHFLAKSPAVLFSLKVADDKLLPAWISDNYAGFTGGTLQDWYQQAANLDYVEAADRPTVQDSLSVMRTHDHQSLEYRIHRRDGTTRWVRDDRQLLRDAQGQPIEVLGCWTDITEHRLLEAELRQSQKMESVGLLAGGIAHDFNNLLTVIRCHVELLLGSNEFSGEADESLQAILASADRAGNLTRQLLAFSRKQVMRRENLELPELIGGLTKLLGRTLGEHIAFEAGWEPELPRVSADRGMMEQVIMNLAVNARDAMPGGGKLNLNACVREIEEAHAQQNREARAGRHVCISVADTGSGIAPELLGRIFEPFFTTKEVGKGSGLGLATVYGIVKQHGGWIEVESCVGAGTTFFVFLPISTQPAVNSTPAHAAPPARGGHETILVVEDEPALRRLVQSALQRQGYQVLTAASGMQALQEYSQQLHLIDLLLTDLVMPDGVTGTELAKQLRVRKPSMKAIYMSGYSTDLNGQDGLAGSNVPFLAKPFGPQTLRQIVRACLDDAQPTTAIVPPSATATGTHA